MKRTELSVITKLIALLIGYSIMSVNTPALSKEPERITKHAITNWLMPDQLNNWQTLRPNAEIEITNTTPIKFANGDVGYISSAYTEQAARNFHSNYIVTIPSQKKSIILSAKYGGQYNQIEVIADLPGGTVLIIGAAGSGQGSYQLHRYIVRFNSLEDVTVLHKATNSANTGNCGTEVHRLCRSREVFFNTLGVNQQNALPILETVAEYLGAEPEEMLLSTSCKQLVFSLD